MGLRHPVQPFLGAHCHARALDTPLQLASPSPGHQGPSADQSLGSVPKQPLDASQLAFKLGSKWRTWTSTVQMLRPAPSDKDKRADIIRAHLARAALDHRLFIFGTGGNIV